LDFIITVEYTKFCMDWQLLSTFAWSDRASLRCRAQAITAGHDRSACRFSRQSHEFRMLIASYDLKSRFAPRCRVRSKRPRQRRKVCRHYRTRGDIKYKLGKFLSDPRHTDNGNLVRCGR
jgi:hypothetical protein